MRRGKRRWEVGAIRYAGKRSRLCQSVANASVRNADKFPEELSGKVLDVTRTCTRDRRVSKMERRIVSAKTKFDERQIFVATDSNFNPFRKFLYDRDK